MRCEMIESRFGALLGEKRVSPRGRTTTKVCTHMMAGTYAPPADQHNTNSPRRWKSGTRSHLSPPPWNANLYLRSENNEPWEEAHARCTGGIDRKRRTVRKLFPNIEEAVTHSWREISGHTRIDSRLQTSPEKKRGTSTHEWKGTEKVMECLS